MLSYNGYHATVEFLSDDGLLRGRVLDLRDTVVFEVEHAAEVEAAFRAAVDDYVAFCAEVGRTPERPYSGRFNVRLEPDLHKRAALAAETRAQSLNAFVQEAIRNEIDRRQAA